MCVEHTWLVRLMLVEKIPTTLYACVIWLYGVGIDAIAFVMWIESGLAYVSFSFLSLSYFPFYFPCQFLHHFCNANNKVLQKIIILQCRYIFYDFVYQHELTRVKTKEWEAEPISIPIHTLYVSLSLFGKAIIINLLYCYCGGCSDAKGTFVKILHIVAPLKP